MTIAECGSEERVVFAIETLLRSDGAWRGLVRDLVARWPDLPPLDVGLTLVSAASAIETAFSRGSPAHEGAAQGYRLAALLSMDVYAMQILELPCTCAADLHSYWKIDPFFERL